MTGRGKGEKVLEKEVQSVTEKFSVMKKGFTKPANQKISSEEEALNVSLDLSTKKLEAFSKFSWRTLSVMQ